MEKSQYKFNNNKGVPINFTFSCLCSLKCIIHKDIDLNKYLTELYGHFSDNTDNPAKNGSNIFKIKVYLRVNTGLKQE